MTTPKPQRPKRFLPLITGGIATATAGTAFGVVNRNELEILAQKVTDLNARHNQVVRVLLDVEKDIAEIRDATCMMSLRSLFVVRDTKLLHKLCTEMRPEPLIERLLSQSFVQSRRENRLFFYDYSTMKIGHASFINRAKYISELLPFEWLNLSAMSFHRKLFSILPQNLKL
jgi:hypothetical protein